MGKEEGSPSTAPQCPLAVIKAGGIAVGTMSLLRAKELAVIVCKAAITHALCDASERCISSRSSCGARLLATIDARGTQRRSVRWQPGPRSQLLALTWYVVDKDEYLASYRPRGRAWREVLGSHYPAMTAVQVAALIEDGAKVEIEATAVIPGPI